METISRRTLIQSLLAGPALLRAESQDGWVDLFDGKSLKGWRAAENPGSWKVDNGLLIADGPRSHLFYAGGVRDADFRNFELRVQWMTWPGANSGVFFHTRYQESGWPAQGLEIQVANTHKGEGAYRERKRTGSLYAVRNVYKNLARDNEWNELHIVVRGRRVEVSLNGLLVVDFREPDPPVLAADALERRLSHGTIALQGHDPHSRVAFKSVRVKPLPDDLDGGGDEPVVDDTCREIARLSASNYPVVDYHVHLKGGFGLEDALRESRRTGVFYGLAVNCGKGFPVQDDRSAIGFVESLRGQPVFVAMQAEGREWVKMFSPEAMARFDYVFTDSMTWSDDRGRRMRLWIPAEVGDIDDPQQFMDTLTARTRQILSEEPIHIYVNPTFLPASIAARYDELWTPERMDRVIEAAVRRGIAIEINNRYRIPSAAFLKRAKQAGALFTFGTNNTDANVGRLEYGIEMVKECGLRWQDFWIPPREGERAPGAR